MKYALLALLAQAPAHGYELKSAFENLFGAVLPPVNAGQIYTTLGRLERDGLVEDYTVEQDDRPDKRVYQLTAEGRATLADWIGAVTPSTRFKDEFFTRLVLARAAQMADPCKLIESQRKAYLQELRHLNELYQEYLKKNDDVAMLLVEGAMLHLEADLKWLDKCEETFS